MSYHPTECIFDLLAASGPQERAEMMQECKTQCGGFPLRHMEDRMARIDLLDSALKSLAQAGIVVMDEIGAYDLTDFGSQLVLEWNNREHHRHSI